MGGLLDRVRAAVGPLVYPASIGLSVSAWHLPGEPIAPAAVVGQPGAPFSPFAVGGAWGGMWGTTWFRFRATVPADWAGREVAALVHLGGDDVVGFSAEGLVFVAGPDGPAVQQGLHHQHREIRLRPAERTVDFYVEAAANPIPPWHLPDWPRLEPDYGGDTLYRLEQADLVVVDGDARALLVEAALVAEMAEWIPERSAEAESALDAALALLAAASPAAVGAARIALAPVLSRPGGPLGADRHTVWAVGHAHIDTAWLWPVRETQRKCARSFANQLRIMERDPDHRFACSQAIHYKWIKESYPDLFDSIKKQVAAGRWEPVGGMWVEADANMPSGESLIRQFVFGKRFFLQEFGVETHEMWIPDVFGYSAALPQIARAAGIDALITQKMSWNDTNDFPHSTFWWEGHDGSRILAHFPPVNTYNGQCTIGELRLDQVNFKDRSRSGHTLYPFGHGDGGGGPTAAMLERARRMADVEGIPAVRIGTVAGFLNALRASSAGLATWVGELYLEAHRATPTTHADVKLGNRRGEEALRAAEMWSVAAGVDSAAQLAPLWELLLLHQFHDILPGSSIAWVYRDSGRDHAFVRTGAEGVIDRAISALAEAGPAVFNPSSYARTEVASGSDGEPAILAAPGCGWAPAEHTRLADLGWKSVTIGDGWMDNGILRVHWNGDGLLTSVWDHEADREVLASGSLGNLLQLHEDHPKAFDAWDVDREYLDSYTDITLATAVSPLESSGPLRAAVRVQRSFGQSSIEQLIRLSAGSRRIEFDTTVDWQERHRFLKVAFPVAVRAMRASYEIQHGYVERPTIENTSWDRARFEVCAHRWADLSEPGYGVALINDGKYGYDIRGHTLRLSLLRGPGFPDPDADRGVHHFRYALMPHVGDLRAGRVVEEAEAFNLPLRQVGAGPSAPGQVVSVDRSGVSVEAVKWADDGSGVVVRLCEVHGSRGPVRVTLGVPWGGRVTAVDVLERPWSSGGPAPSLAVAADGSVGLYLRPFEFVTLRFSPP